MAELIYSYISPPRLHRQIRRLYRVIRVVIHIFFGLYLACLYRAWTNPYRESVRGQVRRWTQILLKIMNVKVDVVGKPHEGVAFAASNHVSWLDIPVVLSFYDVHLLSKAEVASWPLIGKLAYAAGTLFIQRGSGDGNKKAMEITHYLQRNHSVLIYPEGTTTDGQQVRRFHSKLFAAAINASVPVQPISISYRARQGGHDVDVPFIGDDAFHLHLWRLLLKDSVQAKLVFSPVLPTGLEISPNKENRFSSAKLAEACRAKVVASLSR